MVVILWLLADGPDDMHGLVHDVVVRVSRGAQLLSEQNGRLAVLFEADGSGEVVGAAPEGVNTGRGAVASVVVADAGRVASGHADDHVGAVHSMELALGGVAGDTLA